MSAVSSYQIVTDRIIAQLKLGVVPWQKPWNMVSEGPRNIISNKLYRGINVWLLMGAGYSSPFWMTFKQALSLGGHVRKGEHGTPITFWKITDRAATEAEKAETGKSRVKSFFLRTYTVFNLAQCEKIPADKIPSIGAVTANPVDAAEAMVTEYLADGPSLSFGHDGAFYSANADAVGMPNRELFATAGGYYSTLFHELTHSTGHESRLDREIANPFGSKGYAKEELVAEMGAAFLTGEAGLLDMTVKNSAAYISTWLEALENDDKLVVHAASAAQRAVDFIRGRQASEEGTDETTPAVAQLAPFALALAA